MCRKTMEDEPLVKGGQGRSAKDIEDSAWVVGYVALAAFVLPLFIWGDDLVRILTAVAGLVIGCWVTARLLERQQR